jgi:hypothetical protein
MRVEAMKKIFVAGPIGNDGWAAKTVALAKRDSFAVHAQGNN